MGLLDNPFVKGIVNKAKTTAHNAGQGAEDIGSGLAEKQRNIDEAFGKPSEAAKPAPAKPSKPTRLDKVNPGREYGDAEGAKHGEVKIDTTEMTRPLGSFAKGTASVPKTGVYKVHKGEKVVPASENRGAPADFSGRVLSNPGGVKPMWDTDKPAAPKPEVHGAKGDVMTPEEMRTPIGSFAKGTDSVPKTGVYKVHEGEKIVPAKENTMSEHSPSEKAHFHRAMSHLHKGALHRHFGIAEGEPIPMEKKQEAANSDNPHVAAMGRMAVAMHGWGKGK